MYVEKVITITGKYHTIIYKQARDWQSVFAV